MWGIELTRIGPNCYTDDDEEIVVYKGVIYYRDGVIHGMILNKKEEVSPDQLSLLDVSLFDETA